MKFAFDVDKQNTSIDHKIVVALERISEAFRVLLWDEAKKTGLSPIQIQILIFLQYHPTTPNTPSYLADEFNVTRATITDSVRLLLEKGIITKTKDPADARSYQVALTSEGKRIAQSTSAFSSELLGAVGGLKEVTRSRLFDGLYEIIEALSQQSVISVQRMCKNCRFLQNSDGQLHCRFLDLPLEPTSLRIDCPEFEGK